jgi:probable phosphoglycerate mutase
MWDDVAQKWPEQHKIFIDTPEKFDMEGAETAQVLSARGAQAVKHIQSQVSTGDVLVVSHGVLIKTIILDVAKQPLSVLWEKPHLNNCCRSVLQINEDGVAAWLSVADVPVEDVGWAIE